MSDIALVLLFIGWVCTKSVDECTDVTFRHLFGALFTACGICAGLFSLGMRVLT